MWDPVVLYTLHRAVINHTKHNQAIALMAMWIVCSKVVKLTTHLLRHPTNILLLPAYFAFAYYHSFIKFWALLRSGILHGDRARMWMM
jgi:hypothetical protein